MRSTLLITSEQPPTLLDVKAALLTYDTVKLVDPDDRDLFPSTGIMMAMGMPPVISMPTPNPVRRIGKAPGFDNDFEQLLDALAPAFRQESVSIVRTYQPPAPEVRIGMVDLGGFPLDLPMLLTLFRSAAADAAFQEAAIRGDQWLMADADRIFAIAEQRGNADGTINDSEPIADIAFPLANEVLREPLSNIARARIGHTVKLVGFCMTQDLVPHGSHPSHDAILRQFLRNSAKVIDSVSEVDPYWNYRNRALRLAHEEYLNFDRLDAMSVQDVLALRTELWGRQVESRDALFAAVGELSRSVAPEVDFEKSVSEKIRDYRQLAAELEDDRAQLSFKIHCELGKAVLGAAASGTAGTAAGSIASLGTAVGAAAALIAGAYFGLQQLQDFKPVADQLRHLEDEFTQDLRFGVHNFYSSLP